MPSSDKASSSTASSVATRPTRSRVASSPRERLYSARIGTNACENAPSANSRRRILGKRNAASKASICKPAPKPTALRLSRTSPVILDSSVNALTVDSALSRFIARRACASRPSRGSGLEWVAQTENRRKSAEASDRQQIWLAPNPESRYYARSFWGAPPNASLALFSAPSAPVPATHPQSQSRIHEHGKHCPSAQTCPASGGEASAQREPQVVAAHCAEESQESHRRRRQGGRDQGIQGAAVGDRPHRRQEGRAQEHGVAKQGATGAGHQGAAVARSSFVTEKSAVRRFFFERASIIRPTLRIIEIGDSVHKLASSRESGDP